MDRGQYEPAAGHHGRPDGSSVAPPNRTGRGCVLRWLVCHVLPAFPCHLGPANARLLHDGWGNQLVCCHLAFDQTHHFPGGGALHAISEEACSGLLGRHRRRWNPRGVCRRSSLVASRLDRDGERSRLLAQGLDEGKTEWISAWARLTKETGSP